MLLGSKNLFSKILYETFKSYLFYRLTMTTHFLVGKRIPTKPQSQGMKTFGDGQWGAPHKNYAWPLAPQTLTSPDGVGRPQSPPQVRP